MKLSIGVCYLQLSDFNKAEMYLLKSTKLQEFEKDLHKHIHLENNILFPKALEMYESTFSPKNV